MRRYQAKPKEEEKVQGQNRFRFAPTLIVIYVPCGCGTNEVTQSDYG